MIKPTMLVVDDEKKFTSTFVEFLEDEFNANVVLKETAKDAIEYINSNRVDILFQDIHLEGTVNGFVVVRHIHSVGKAKDIKIFMISKWQDDLSYAKQIEEYKVSKLPKPLSLETTKVALINEFERRGGFNYKK